jgi:MerR family transcriptional regulator, copper efflux regulator
MSRPIACTLSVADQAARAEGTARIPLRSREPIAGGARLSFAAGAETELRRIVAAEARCCPFLRMDLRAAGDALVLDITGPAEAAPIIAQLFPLSAAGG